MYFYLRYTYVLVYTSMCGIFACITNEFMIDYMRENGFMCRHRGPDSSVEYKSHAHGQDIFFLFHRLAINGLDEGSNQPFEQQDVVLMCNGEIYNYKELAKVYSCTLRTHSDCEIIIHLYRLLGIQMISLLDGVFSFVLYDRLSQIVYVGHDPLGIRSLYMSTDNGLFVSSELKCLQNFKKHVELVEPGVYHSYDLLHKRADKTVYYTLCHRSLYKSDDICISMIRKLLGESVQKRLLSDRPIGCLLSGGLDSSIIAGIMCTYRKPELVKTFSIGLEGSPDLEAAQLVADHLGTNHTSVVVSEKSMLSAIRETIKQIESYDTTTVRASVPMYLLAKYIKEYTDITVVLSGEGADELSGSYLYFHKAPGPKEFQRECERLVRDVQHYDVLRCDKTTAGNSLEVRVPFFDKTFVKEYMNIDPALKMVREQDTCHHEKYLLRKAFEKELPESIVWRRKEGFSDGVSSLQKPWYQIVNEYTHTIHNCSEKEYYQGIFREYYPRYEYICPYEWLPKWVERANPSGRLIL